MNDDRTPGAVSPEPGLLPDEYTVGTAYARLIPLLNRLHTHPFARSLYAELSDYLDGEAWEAADAFDRLLCLSPEELTERLDQLGPDLLDEDEDDGEEIG